MKTLDLNACGVKEMNELQMQEVEGGCIFEAIGNAFKTAVNAVTDAARAVADWCSEHISSSPNGGIRISF
jgi:hypothetical protein